MKRFVRRESLRRPDTEPITSPKAFFQLVENKVDTITSDFCSIEDHQNIKLEISERFKSCKTITDTRSFHSFVPISNKEIKCKLVSNFDDTHSQILNIHVIN